MNFEPESNELHEALLWLGDIDQQLDRVLGSSRASLNPSDERARSLVVVSNLVTRGETKVSHQIALIQGLGRLAQAQLTNFPGNLFWDFEFLASSLFRQATLDSSDFEVQICQRFDQIIALQALFGSASNIRFRYVHDFVYGFDWCRWVRAKPEQRKHIGPFDGDFLNALSRRGRELLVHIDANDLKYPLLPADVFRNPFGFSRDPREEEELHRELARRNAIPVRAWLVDAEPQWRCDSSTIRANLALELSKKDRSDG